MIKKILAREKGQGLVEYALILVLVAIVVIVILALLGPAVGNVFSNVVAALETLGGSGPITGASASWAGPNVIVSVTVSETVVVSASIVSGSGGGPIPGSQTCNPGFPCVFTVTGASANGAVKVMGGGGHKTASW
jgi:pilus assembly protein Flp/PilA